MPSTTLSYAQTAARVRPPKTPSIGPGWKPISASRCCRRTTSPPVMPVLSGAAIVDFGVVVVVVAAAVVVVASVVAVAASSRPSPPMLTAPATTAVATSAIAATAGRTPTRCPPAVAALTDPNLGVRRPKRHGGISRPSRPAACRRARIMTDRHRIEREPRGAADLSARRREHMWTR